MPHVVVTQAIGGNRLLNRGRGPSALERFDRDVLAVPGVSHVLLLEGVNDLAGIGPDNPIGAEDLIAGYRQIVARAREHHLKIFISPILPWKNSSRHTAEREEVRLAVNNWIRTSGAFDAVIEFDRVVADPADPSQIAARYNTGDSLHPNADGKIAMANAIDLGLFRDAPRHTYQANMTGCEKSATSPTNAHISSTRGRVSPRRH